MMIFSTMSTVMTGWILLLTMTLKLRLSGATNDTSIHVVYNIDYSQADCGSSAVGLKGFIVGENSTFVAPGENGDKLSCAQATQCPIHGQVSEDCPTSNDFSLNYDETTGGIVANPSWGLVGPNVCNESVWIPGCYYNYQQAKPDSHPATAMNDWNSDAKETHDPTQ